MERGGALTRPRKRLMSRGFSLVSRLVIWYSIFTIIFRCPTSQDELEDTSPYICKPYFSTKSQVAPYVRPYYDSYASPYVEIVQPYAEKFYTTIYVPASILAVDSYTKYAAPRVGQARAFAEDEWQKAVVPRIEVLRGKAEEQYHILLEPYVQRVNVAILPHFEDAKVIALRQYRDVIVPSYQVSIPHIQNAYDRGQTFVVDTGIPYTVWAYKGLVTFTRRRVWPPLRIVYGKNVEPQLSKIRERLSSYRDSKNLEAAIELANDSAPTEQSQVEASTSAIMISSASSETLTDETDIPLADESPSTASSVPNQEEPSTSESENGGKLTDELKSWQAKFSKASDKGAEDLSVRVAEITDRQIDSQVEGLGNALVTRLEEAAERELGNLKAIILDAVQSLPEDSTEEDRNAAYSSVLSAIRSAGASLKNKAQELRVWKIKYRQETESLVQSASDSTLDVIDNIRDLGLQQIGMRWATMDDVTFQDWAEYHKLKKTFDTWRVQVASIASDHEGLAKALQMGEELEDRGMGIAQNSAAELARMKDVARWKIHAQDTSDDFDSRQLPAAAVKLGQKLKDKAADAKSFVKSLASTQGLAESVMSAATDGAASALSSASSIVVEPFSEITASATDDIPKEDSNDARKSKEELATNVLNAVRNIASKRKATKDAQSTPLEDSDASNPPTVESIISTGDEAIKSILGKAFGRESSDEEVTVPSEGTAPSESDSAEKSAEQATEEPASESTDEEDALSSAVTASVESIIPKAARSASSIGSSVLSEVTSIFTEAESAGDEEHDEKINPSGSLSSRVTSIIPEPVASAVESASEDLSDQISRASEAATAAAEDYESSAESAYGKASATLVNSASFESEDVMDQAQAASQILQSRVNKAGEEYSTVTETLLRVSSEPESANT